MVKASEARTRLRYLDQECSQTLRSALNDYFASIPGLLSEDNAPKWVADLFRRHDVGHVVFGCDTTLNGEPLADTFCMFGTDVTLKEYMRYAEIPETKEIFKQAGVWRSLVATIRSLPRIGRALWRCWRMPKKWPFWENDRYLDMPLTQIRQEFGIRVIRH